MEGYCLEEMFEKVAGAGFSSVELGFEAKLEEFLRGPGEMRRMLEAVGLRAWSLHSPSAGWNNGSADEAKRRKSIEAAAATFGPAAEAGVEIVICHCNLSAEKVAAEDYDACKALSVESLGILADRARQAGVKMAVENLPVYGKIRPGGSAEEVRGMIEGLGEDVGICIDTGHCNANGRMAAEEARVAGEKLMAVHMHDNDGKGEDQHLIPGEGTVDWETFGGALDEMRFAGPRTFEVVPVNGSIDITLDRLRDLHAEWQKPVS